METLHTRQPVVDDSLQPSEVLPPADLIFARRAARLRHLAKAHPSAFWLDRLAQLSDAQHAILAAEAASANASPSARWVPAFRELAARLEPELASTPEHRLALRAASCFSVARGETAPGQRDRLDLLVAAAQQVAWTNFAMRLSYERGTRRQRSTHCPCCGCAALGSIVLAGEGRAGLRYLECAMCATRWHAVRAHCCFCDAAAPVDYLSLAGVHPAVQAEACSSCGAYLKTLFQTRDAEVDPLADDLATLALDVLVCKEGFVRGAPNLFLCECEPA